MTEENPTVVTIKFDQYDKQTPRSSETPGSEWKRHKTDITRISGFVLARHFISIIDSLDLEANPRSARVGKVTNAITESITNSPDEFPFMTKGILLGATQFVELQDRNRVRATFVERDKEGILDGGHNTIAIGLQILRVVGVSEDKVRKVKDWESFRALWDESKEQVKKIRGEKSDFGNSEPSEDDGLGFLIPVELLVPSDPDDELILEHFKSSLLEICAARNNNAELAVQGKSNQAGLYDELKNLLPNHISQRIEWKPGDNGRVKVSDLIALTWIPLSLLDPITSGTSGKPIAAPIPQNLYRNKSECLSKFDDLMRSSSVAKEVNGTYELHNTAINSALKVAAKMPEVFDLIEELFPGAYNKADGKYGRIGAVKKMNATNTTKTTTFEGRKIEMASPAGFLYPIVYGVRELLIRKDDGTIDWKINPIQFIRDNIDQIAESFKSIVSFADWDPQKVGKAPAAYETAVTAYQKVLMKYGI